MPNPKHLLSLKGKMETISMMELRNNPGSIMTAVECGKVFVILRWDKPIAVLSKVPGETLTIVIDPDGKYSYSLGVKEKD